MSAGHVSLPSVSKSGNRLDSLYWGSTGLLIAQLVVSASLLIIRPTMVTTVVRHLGYPDYFPIYLGIAKALAAVAIAQAWSATLREWAYAGVTFDLLAASLSQLAVHDSGKEVAGPLVIMSLVVISYTAYLKTGRQS